MPYEVKGTTVYITAGEERATTAILVGEICGLVALISYGALTVYRQNDICNGASGSRMVGCC